MEKGERDGDERREKMEEGEEKNEGRRRRRDMGEGMKKGERRRNRKIRRKENSKKEKIIGEKKRNIKFE